MAETAATSSGDSHKYSDSQPADRRCSLNVRIRAALLVRGFGIANNQPWLRSLATSLGLLIDRAYEPCTSNFAFFMIHLD